VGWPGGGDTWCLWGTFLTRASWHFAFLTTHGLAVRALPQTMSTWQNHSYSPYVRPLLQAAHHSSYITGACNCPEVCRCWSYTPGCASWLKQKVNNSNRFTTVLFYNYKKKKKTLHISTYRGHHRYSSTEHIKRLKLHYYKWGLIYLLLISGLIGW
jgi:hypothetical protein